MATTKVTATRFGVFHTREAAERAFSSYTAEYFTTVAVERGDFERAASRVSQEDIKLRASDALHLAIAERMRLEMATLDTHLHNAASAIGIRAFTL